MATAVVMPQMGESIAEGTIVRWIKKVGDQVHRDEPLFEISTDKVDAEIPSPAAGVLTEIKVQEGETVAVDAVVATIGQPGEVARAPKVEAPALPQPQADGTPKAVSKPNGQGAASVDDLRRQKSSPLVRKIARENNVDISELHGSGIGGRVTKDDILGHLAGATPNAQLPTPRSQEPGARLPSGSRSSRSP